MGGYSIRPGHYRGRRRHAGPASRLGVAAIAGVVVVALVGTGVLARVLSDAPAALPLLPPAPTASPTPGVVDSAGGGPGQPGQARTPGESPSATPTPSPSVAPDPVRPAGRAPAPPEPAPAPDPGADPAPPAQPLAVEAEDAELSDHEDVEVRRMSSASGGEVVRLSGWWFDRFVRLDDLTVASGGRHELVVFYTYAFSPCDWNPCAARIWVNGEDSVVEFPEPSGPIGSVTVPITLAGGENRIVVSGTPQRAAPSLDLITITD